MNITDLVEYSSLQKKFIRTAGRLGFEPKPFLNPELTESELDVLKVRALYNIQDDNDYKQYQAKYQFRDIVENLQVKEVRENLRAKHPNFNHKIEDEALTPLWMKEIYQILEMLNDAQIEQFKSEYVKYLREGIMVKYHNGIIKEILITGRINMMIDDRFDLITRLIITDIYQDTGIDIRVIPNFDYNQLYRDWYNKDGTMDFFAWNDTEMSKRYSPEELKLYRKLSNKFREYRANNQQVFER